jgi:Ala-tRNA(Pro) deacylase
MEPIFDRIKALLDQHHFDYKVFEHEHVVTSEDAARIRGTDIRNGAKALVLQSKSGRFFMIVISAAERVDLKKFKQVINEKNVSLASPEEVLKKTGCTVGSVPPFGNLFDIPVYIDSSFLNKERIVFSAGSHTKSIEMNLKDYLEIVKPRAEDLRKNLA